MQVRRLSMKLQKIDQKNINAAVSGIESWMNTIRGEDGYYGPVIGARNQSMMYCGPGFDWRYEGIFSGYIKMHRATGSAMYLDKIERDLNDIFNAQLFNGTFKNSFFEFNPFEGSLFHEASMLAAMCKARKYLIDVGRGFDQRLDTTVELYVKNYLLKELWNKQLLTFNDWPVTNFENFTPHAVAAAVDLLLEYFEMTGEKGILYYIEKSIESLLSVQEVRGDGDGGIYISSNEKGVISPLYSARILSVLTRVYQITHKKKHKNAAESLVDFLYKCIGRSGNYDRLLIVGRSPVKLPIFPGAIAYIVECLISNDFIRESVIEENLDFILQHQNAAGSFDTAIGFAGNISSKKNPDWRDVMPVCGWQDKIYSLFAGLCFEVKDVSEKQFPLISRAVSFKGRGAVYHEDEECVRLESSKGKMIYLWKKNEKWATECRL